MEPELRKTGATVRHADPQHFAAARRLTIAGVSYRFGHRLAIGASSAVFLAADEWGNPLIVKQYQPESDPGLWKNEIDNLRRFRHPRITFMHTACEHEGSRYIVLERWGAALERISVDDQVQRETLCRIVARSLLEALHVIHTAGYLHGDINPGNILVQQPSATLPAGVKLCDLALCRPVARGASNLRLAAWNPAPEIYDRGAFGMAGQPMDIYHAGLVLLQLLSGKLPVFSEEDIIRGAPQELARGQQSHLGRALVAALAPAGPERPTAIALWRAIAATRR